MKRTLLTIALLTVPVFTQAQEPATNPYAGETRVEHDARLKWFNEARFGMFIHWGVYAVPAGMWQGKDIPTLGEWAMHKALIPVSDYKAFGRDFTAAKYDPKAWADLAQEAGMKYVILTAKHHDGFALYDSQFSDWNAVKSSAARRDLIAPLAEAVRADGLKFGLYYSHATDWINPGGGAAGFPEGNGWDPAQNGNFDEYLRNVSLPQVKEIFAKYQPSVIWWDMSIHMTLERVKPFINALVMVPGIISNNRLGGNYGGDFITPEQNIPARGYPGTKFEVCLTMNETWGYKKHGGKWKSTGDLLRVLSEVVSKGGNLLMNVGPTAAGEFPPECIERLKAIGKWMAVNGEAIHGTEAGPFPRRFRWGRTTLKTQGAKTTLFLHIWDWPQDHKLLLPTLKELPVAASMLAGRQRLKTTVTTDGLVVALPEAPTDPDISVAALEFDRPLVITQNPYVTPDPSGKLVFSPFDADFHGNDQGTMKITGSGTNACIEAWRSPKWNLEYAVQSAQKQTWKITAEIRAEKPSRLSVGLKDRIVQVAIPASESPGTWKTVDLGTVELPAGKSSVFFNPVADGWSPVQVRDVTILPL